jgi:hypothetical protein
MTPSLRALLAGEAVTVHAVVLGPIDTDKNRGFEIPKASPESAAVGIFDGLEKGEEDIFPDPASQSIAASWHDGVPKALERQFAASVPGSAEKVAQRQQLRIRGAVPIVGQGNAGRSIRRPKPAHRVSLHVRSRLGGLLNRE